MYCAFPIFEFNFSFFLKKYLVILPFFECQLEAFKFFLKIQEKYPVFLIISKCSFNNNLNFFNSIQLYLRGLSSGQGRGVQKIRFSHINLIGLAVNLAIYVIFVSNRQKYFTLSTHLLLRHFLLSIGLKLQRNSCFYYSERFFIAPVTH